MCVRVHVCSDQPQLWPQLVRVLVVSTGSAVTWIAKSNVVKTLRTKQIRGTSTTRSVAQLIDSRPVNTTCRSTACLTGCLTGCGDAAGAVLFRNW